VFNEHLVIILSRYTDLAEAICYFWSCGYTDLGPPIFFGIYFLGFKWPLGISGKRQEAPAFNFDYNGGQTA
jgi:hypothetical protein